MKWCDLTCPHARWPDTRALDGACRTVVGLYCSRLNRVVEKNGPCRLPDAGHEPEGRPPEKPAT